MKYTTHITKYTSAILFSSVILASCGGGGGGTGGATDFSIFPAEGTLTFEKGNTTCYEDPGFYSSETVVTIVAGAPPYRIVNSSPDNIAISATSVDGKNPSFKVWTLAGCGKYPILVIDNMGRATTYTATMVGGEEITTTSTTTTPSPATTP